MANQEHDPPALMRVAVNEPYSTLTIFRETPKSPMTLVLAMPQYMEHLSVQPSHILTTTLELDDIENLILWMHSICRADGLLPVVSFYADGHMHRSVQVVRASEPTGWSRLDINREKKVTVTFDVSPLNHPRVSIKYIPEVGPEEIEAVFFLDDPLPSIARDLWDNLRQSDATLLKRRLIPFIKTCGSSLKKVLA